MPSLCHATTAVRAASAAKTIIASALTLAFLAGTAMAQRPAAVAPGAPVAARAPAPGIMAPIGYCDNLQSPLSPAQQRIDGCTALIQSKRLTPQNLAGAYFNRGLAYASQHDYARAIIDYNEAIRLSPRYPHAYKNRGIAYQEQHDYARAMTDYNEALRQNASLDSVYTNRGYIYFSQRDFARAIADYDEAIRLNPRNGLAYTNRGNAYRALNDNVRATADFKEAARLEDPRERAATDDGIVTGLR